MPAKTKPSHNSYRNLSLEDITYSAIFGLRPYEHKTQQKVLTYVIFFSFHDFRRHYDYKRGESSSVSKKLQFRQLTSRNPQKNWNVILLPRHVQQKTKKVNNYSPTEDDFWNTSRQSSTAEQRLKFSLSHAQKTPIVHFYFRSITLAASSWVESL